MPAIPHQYVDRDTGDIRTERLYQDRLVRWMYCRLRERAPAVFRALTGRRMSKLAGLVNYDLSLGAKLAGSRRFIRELDIDLSECLDPLERLDTARKVFERQIRYWQCRPMPSRPDVVVSPADARVLLGSFRHTSQIFVKEKFFRFEQFFSVRPRRRPTNRAATANGWYRSSCCRRSGWPCSCSLAAAR